MAGQELTAAYPQPVLALMEYAMSQMLALAIMVGLGQIATLQFVILDVIVEGDIVIVLITAAVMRTGAEDCVIYLLHSQVHALFTGNYNYSKSSCNSKSLSWNFLHSIRTSMCIRKCNKNGGVILEPFFRKKHGL